LFPESATTEMMVLMASLQLGFLSLNLDWFLAYHIVLIMLTIEACMTILHWGDQPLSHKDQISRMDWNCKEKFRIEASQHQAFMQNCTKKEEDGRYFQYV